MTAIQRSRTLDSRLKNRKGKATLYPKGSDGLCSVEDCREIAEWHVNRNVGLRCTKHVTPSYSMPPGIEVEMDIHRLPHIIRKEEDGKLYVKCLFCLREWRPLSFDLPKEDKDYGRIPHKCSRENCRQTILTRSGRQPRFLRGSGFKGLIKGGGKS